jgi:N-acetylglucosaminyldiphosphoundecaprenol N-acetyl-beta-D-mannosaminyltransferase
MNMDGSSPVPLVIYGVPFHNVTFDEAIDWIVERVRSGRPANIATANLDFVTRAWNDPELQRILIDADLVLADGFPIVKLAPFFGPKLKGRVTGSDLTPMLAGRAAQEGFRLYGLGSAAGVAEEAMKTLRRRNPRLKVAGTYSPPYTPLLEMDHRDILKRLEAAHPDILFVALGSPKQEKFISMHVRGWNVPVAMGVGASLDFITGEQRRAPAWIRRIQFEWLWRICCNPRRLFVRYLANVRFLISATRQMISIHYMADRPAPVQVLDDADISRLQQNGIFVERFQGLKDESAIREFIERLGQETADMNLLLDIHAVPWLNSLELGALLEINKACRRVGKRMILYAPRPKVRRLLETCRLNDYFDSAIRLDAVESIVKNLREHGDGSTVYEEGALTLELPMELTAATLPTFERETDFIHHELQSQGILRTVSVDASQLDFIDSSGLGFLISLKRATQDEGVSMSIANLGGKARRVFEIARVDKVLLHT